MTVDELRDLLQPLYGLCPIDVEIVPCPPVPPRRYLMPRDIAPITGVRIINHTGAILLQIERLDDC